MSKKSKIIGSAGFRKTAIARAHLKPGSGKIRVNKVELNKISPEMVQLRMSEPLIIAESLALEVDIDIKVHGGGITSQADAVRLAIARALNTYSKDKLKKIYLEYDRTLLVADTRRKEAKKPNTCGNARAKRQKSYR